MGQPVRFRSSLIPPLLYIGAVLAAAVGLCLPAQRQSLVYLIQEAGSVLWPLLLALPILIGLAVLLFTQRFWVWPFVYLAAYFTVFGGLLIEQRGHAVEAAFEYTRVLTIALTVFVAELVGLFIGRLASRPLALAFFGGAAIWLGMEAVARMQNGEIVCWHNAVSWIAAAGFALQSGLQLHKYLEIERSKRDGYYDPAEEAPEEDYSEPVAVVPPRPSVNEGALPWKVIIGEKPPLAAAAALDGEPKAPSPET